MVIRLNDLYTFGVIRKVTAISTIFFFIFFVPPFIFKYSISFQRFVMFPRIKRPFYPQYNNFEKYGFRGARNMYIKVKDLNSENEVYLGVWHVLPLEYINETNIDFNEALNSTDSKVVIYLHGNSGTRIYPCDLYHVLRRYFHVFAVDYRGYGDSTDAVLSEEAIVNDLKQFYKWIRNITAARIFIWGHSLGTAIGTRTVAELKQNNIIPTGLILESPFTTMREEIPYHPLGRVFSWLPYFKSTILDPLDANGFTFLTIYYILSVDCPIMILHAKDDIVVPYILGEKLANIANEERNLTIQGNVTFHLFDAKYKYNHLRIRNCPELPAYIESIHFRPS